MPQHTPKPSPASSSHAPAISPNQVANVAAPASLESKEAQAGIEGLVESLADLQTEVLLSALESTRRKGTKMADRTLTAEAALNEVTALPDIKKHLKEQQEEAQTQVAGIRARVILEQLQKFDDGLDDWVNA